jgi:hypothetical protein
VIAESGALASVEAAIETEVDRALHAVGAIDDTHGDVLTRLALFAAYRNR